MDKNQHKEKNTFMKVNQVKPKRTNERTTSQNYNSLTAQPTSTKNAVITPNTQAIATR